MHLPTSRHLPAFAAVLLATHPASGAISITAGNTATHQSALELSGIAWAGGNQYYAVEDQTGTLYPLTISVNSPGGSSCTVGTPVTLANASDLEGCAWDPGSSTVWVSMESTSTPIREYNPTTGEQLRTAPVPSIFISNRRGNYSLEALTISGDGLTMWTCNEESLTCDGERSTTSSGCYVRLARFTRPTLRANWVADGQWAYQTDPLRSSTSLASTPRSGVSGLCALPDGTLLVLEREFSGLSFRLRYYTVDFSGADNIETLAAFDASLYTAVSKTKVYENSGGMANYEGFCLGPRTASNQAALVAIADGGGSASAYVQHLKLTGLDIAAVTYTGPAGAEPVGGPFRYVAGSTVSATLPTAGDPYESDLRAHANWSTGGAIGDGSTASFTPAAGESTFAWSFSTNNALALLATDSFERTPVGDEADDIANWSGDGWVAEETYAAPTSGYPLPLETHTRVLSVDGDVERDYTDAPGKGSRLELDVRVTRETAESHVAEVETPLQVALYFDEQGRPTLQHMAADGSARATTTLSSQTFANGDWVRIGITFDYTTGAAGTGWCQVSINGAPCSTTAGVAAPTRTNASGPWYRIVGSGATKVSTLTLKGNGAVDDVALYDDEPVPASIPATVFWVGNAH
jgi:hypothetical protein